MCVNCEGHEGNGHDVKVGGVSGKVKGMGMYASSSFSEGQSHHNMASPPPQYARRTPQQHDDGKEDNALVLLVHSNTSAYAYDTLICYMI